MPSGSKRIERTLSLAGRGLSGTVEQVRTLQRVVVGFYKRIPKRSFEEVLSSSSSPAVPPSASQTEPLSAAPPAMAFTHPAQRDMFGRPEKSDEKVVLKG